MTLSILIEFCGLIQSLSQSHSPVKRKDSLLSIELPSLITKALLGKVKDLKISDARDELRNAIFTLCNWINAPIQEIPPLRLDLKSTLDLLILKIKDEVPELAGMTYHIFIDEFENLTTHQQRIINTLMKHGRSPLLFSIAHKKMQRFRMKL